MASLANTHPLSNHMHPRHIFRRWNESLSREMYKARISGRADKNPAEFWYNGEIGGFFKFYIFPLANKLKNCQFLGNCTSSGQNTLTLCTLAQKMFFRWTPLWEDQWPHPWGALQHVGDGLVSTLGPTLLEGCAGAGAGIDDAVPMILQPATLCRWLLVRIWIQDFLVEPNLAG
jgi:hypothetical protein